MKTVKTFSARPGRPGTSEKFAVERGVDFIQKRVVFGTPDPAKATNYAIERSNLTARQWNARLRRRTLAFSKTVTRHCAATALHYVHVNLCHIPRNMRISPAMAAGITDTVWTLDELLDTLLAEEEADALEAKPLTHREPPTPARALPNNRGFLRLVTEPTPALKQRRKSEPPPPPASPVQVVPPPPPAEPQRSMVQLDLFGDPPEEP